MSQSNKTVDNYLVISKVVFTSTEVTGKGETIRFGSNEKLIYSYLRDQYVSFNSQGLDFFQSAQKIADTLGVSLRLVQGILKGFESVGLIVPVKKRGKSVVKSVPDVYESGCKFNSPLFNKPKEPAEPQPTHLEYDYYEGDLGDDGEDQIPF